MSLRLSSFADYETLLDEYDTWLFDCDGVLWRGDQVIDGVVQVLDILRKRGEIPLTKIFDVTFLILIMVKGRNSFSLPIMRRNLGRVIKRNLTSWAWMFMWYASSPCSVYL